MHSDQTSPHTAWVEDVVRYLRQQDDVIVSQENGNFLVNGRFEMPLADLVERANRMRARQQKARVRIDGCETRTAREARREWPPGICSARLSPPMGFFGRPRSVPETVLLATPGGR